jgi:hypothetical protein
MIEGSVRVQIAKSPTHSIAGYRIGGNGGSYYDSGLFDGLLMLIAAVAQQALDEDCKCDGCKHWIQLNKDWGMENVPYPAAGFRTKVAPNRYLYEDYNE